MTRKLLTVDEFRSSAKDGARPDCAVMRVAVADPEPAEDGRKVRFVFSDATVDRSGDSIDPNGWQTSSFMANPVALWAHDSYSPPIGRASNVGPVGSKLMGDIEFMSAEISAFADSIYRMVKGGFVKAVSVGFIPLEWKWVDSKDRPFGIDFLKQELLEISVCPIPCNPNALQEAKSLGIDTEPLREWASRLLDDGSQVLVPRNLLEETFRQAKTPRAVRQKFLGASTKPEWKAGGSRELEFDAKAPWDGAAAAKRILDDAGFDGDSPDAEKAAKGFLLHDGANPLLRSSYKLPFADIVGGKLTAVKAGIEAARSRLDQSDAPAEVRAEAGGLINLYAGLFEDKGQLDQTGKAGRRISAANKELLQKAMDHHESATKCIKDVLASNETDEPDEDDQNGSEQLEDLSPPKKTETQSEQKPKDARAERLAYAAELKKSLKG